jgi:hypothetical protein
VVLAALVVVGLVHLVLIRTVWLVLPILVAVAVEAAILLLMLAGLAVQVLSSSASLTRSRLYSLAA